MYISTLRCIADGVCSYTRSCVIQKRRSEDVAEDDASESDSTGRNCPGALWGCNGGNEQVETLICNSVCMDVALTSLLNLWCGLK